MRAAACCHPQLSEVMVNLLSEVIFIGSQESVLFPLPSCPISFLPQEYTNPSLEIPYVLWYPQAICWNRRIGSSAGSFSPIVAVPSPSRPSFPEPQIYPMCPSFTILIFLIFTKIMSFAYPMDYFPRVSLYMISI